MAAKFAELWRRRMMERPRDDAQLKPHLTAAGKRKPRCAGFSDFSRVYQRQIRRGPQGVGRNQQRRPHAPPFAPAAAPRAAMPAKSATASHLRDKRLLLQRKKRGRERPGVEGNKRHHTAGRYSGWF